MDKNFFNSNYETAESELYKRGQKFNIIKVMAVLLFMIISGIVYVFFPSNDNITVNIADEVLDTVVTETQNFNTSKNNNYEYTESETSENITRETTKSKSKSQILLVNINTAPSKELEKINGIGASLAKNIIDYRTKNGGFAHKEEIKNVKGIGDKLYEKIKDYIVVD